MTETKDQTNDFEKIRDSEWKQFSVLDNLDCSLTNVPEGKYILVSQDCDIVHRSFEKEKNVEIILLKEIDTFDKSKSGLKNFRTPHIPYSYNGETKHFELDMNSRFFIARSELVSRSPINEIIFDDKSKQTIIRLLFARYERTALPEFNQRFPFKKIKKLLKKSNIDPYALFINLSTDEELQEHEHYQIMLIMLVEDNINQVDDLLENIVNEINDRIDVVHYSVKTMDEMTVSELYEYKELWLLDLSFQGEDIGNHLK